MTSSSLFPRQDLQQAETLKVLKFSSAISSASTFSMRHISQQETQPIWYYFLCVWGRGDFSVKSFGVDFGGDTQLDMHNLVVLTVCSFSYFVLVSFFFLKCMKCAPKSCIPRALLIQLHNLSHWEMICFNRSSMLRTLISPKKEKRTTLQKKGLWFRKKILRISSILTLRKGVKQVSTIPRWREHRDSFPAGTDGFMVRLIHSMQFETSLYLVWGFLQAWKLSTKLLGMSSP